MSVRTLLLFNPIAGRGLAQRQAETISRRLNKSGIETSIFESKLASNRADFNKIVSSHTAVVVIGGDGTLFSLLGPLSEIGVPVYMIASGTESLFARSFGMKPEGLEEALRNLRVTSHNLGLVNEKHFFHMVSIGLDSQVIQRIGSTRTGSISHFDYIRATTVALLSHTSPNLSLNVDGKDMISNEDGFLVIGNSPEYAGRIGLVPEANTTEAILHARFYPYKSSLFYLRFGLNYLLRNKADTRRSRLIKGEIFKITSANAPYAVQADGEFVGNTPTVITLAKNKLKVLENKGDYVD